MTINKLETRHDLDSNKRLRKAYEAMQGLIDSLNKKDLSKEIATNINSDIKVLNSFQGSEKELKKALHKTKAEVLKFVENELKYVPKNHYRSLWMVFGMLIGSALSSMSGDPTFISFGLPLGMVLGLAYGTTLDKKVEEEGRQLEMEAG